MPLENLLESGYYVHERLERGFSLFLKLTARTHANRVIDSVITTLHYV